MIGEQFFDPFAVRRIGIENCGINFHQVIASGIAGHAHECIVEVEKVALRRADKNAFLNAGNKCAVFFFRSFTVGNILQNVDRAHLAAGGVGKNGIRCEKIARKPRIGIISLAGNAFAIRTKLICGIFRGK